MPDRLGKGFVRINLDVPHPFWYSAPYVQGILQSLIDYMTIPCEQFEEKYPNLPDEPVEKMIQDLHTSFQA